MMNIVLIGLRGSGKTTIAKILSEKLNKHSIEMDFLLTQQAGISIPEIVEKFGWEHLRNLESEIAKEVSELENVVISTGGGVVARKENVIHLKKNGILFWLQTPVDVLVERIGNDPNRPALTDKRSPKGELMEVLEHRKKQYEDAADFIIDTHKNNPQDAADLIIKHYENQHKN